MRKSNVITLHDVHRRRAKQIQSRPHMRLILTEYHGGSGDRASRSLTIEGALRAAILRIAHGQYTSCEVFDERFGTFGSTLALKITMHKNGIAIEWPKAPKWRYEQ